MVISRDGAISDYRNLLDLSPDAMFVLDEDLTLTYINESIERVLGYDREELIGRDASIFLEKGVVERGGLVSAVTRCQLVMADPDRDHEKFELELRTRSGELIEAEYHVASLRDQDETSSSGVVGVIRDVSELKAREARILDQRDELEMLNTVYGIIHDVIRWSIPAASRTQIEERICGGLTDSPCFVAAVTAELTRGDSMIVRSASPEASPLAEAIDGMGTADSPLATVGTTTSEGDFHVLEGWTEIAALPEALRGATDELGVESVLLLPVLLSHDVPMVLLVFSSREELFTDSVLDGFDVLRELTVFAIDAVQNEQLLRRNKQVELEFQLPTSGTLLGEIAEACGCEVELESLVVLDGEVDAAFVSLGPTDPEVSLADVCQAIDSEVSMAENVTLIAEAGSRVQLEISFRSKVTGLFESGVRIEEVRARPGHQAATLQLAPSLDPSRVVDQLRSELPGAELVARRDVTRPRGSVAEFYSEVLQSLTPKQQQALKTAYMAGYFEWPSRESDAEDLAAMLDISSATLHGHLRKAQRQVMRALFEGDALGR